MWSYICENEAAEHDFESVNTNFDRRCEREFWQKSVFWDDSCLFLAWR